MKSMMYIQLLINVQTYFAHPVVPPPSSPSPYPSRCNPFLRLMASKAVVVMIIYVLISYVCCHRLGPSCPSIMLPLFISPVPRRSLAVPRLRGKISSGLLPSYDIIILSDMFLRFPLGFSVGGSHLCVWGGV